MVKFTSIRIKIYAIIITVTVLVNIFALAVGAFLLTRSINASLEEDMLIAIDITDKYITKEIELLKVMATEISWEINLLYHAGESEGVLERVSSDFSNCIGLALFKDTILYDSWYNTAQYGESAIPQEIIYEPFMQTALKGGKAVSTTVYSPDGFLVMYISAPVNKELVMAVAIPGMYMNTLINKITFWKSGHVYMWDDEGTVIANIRTHWVENRNNFFTMAEEDSSYKGVSQVVKRGIEGERGVGHYSIAEVSRTCAFRPVSSPEGWTAGIVAPTNEGPLKDIPRSLLLMSIMTLCLSSIATIIAAIFLRRQYNEIDSLRRDAENMYEQTIEKNKELEKLHTVKDKLFTVVAHDLRGPIGSMSSMLKFSLVEKIDTDTQSKMLIDLSRRVEDVYELIDNLLCWAKNQMKGMVTTPVYFDAQETTQAVVNNLHKIVSDKKVILNNLVKNQKIFADHDMFTVVVRNLTTNALKYTSAGGEITLSSEISDNMLVVSVRDTGTGMTQEAQKKLFILSETKSTLGTNNESGAGLGLVLCAEFVQANGGRIWFSSIEGEGSTFYFSVPLVE